MKNPDNHSRENNSPKKVRVPLPRSSRSSQLSKSSRIDKPLNSHHPFSSSETSRSPFRTEQEREAASKRRKNVKTRRMYLALGLLSTLLLILTVVLITTEIIDSIKEERVQLEELNERKQRQSASNDSVGNDLFDTGELSLPNSNNNKSEFSFEDKDDFQLSDDLDLDF